MDKSTKKTHKRKSEDTNQEKLYLLHMDLCGPMLVESVNGKKYILVIVDDYSRFTWVKFLRSKDETPDFIIKLLKMIQVKFLRSKDETLDFIIKFLKMIQVRLKVPVRRIRTDNGTEFVNQTLRDYYKEVGISYETSVARSPQQNGIVKRRNRTLIESARTIVPLFAFDMERLPMSFCTENFLTYHFSMCLVLYVIRQMITRRIVETIYVDFDELTAMASEQSSSGPALNEMTPGTISSGLVRPSSPSTSFVPPSRNDWDCCFNQCSMNY
nr:hypothetical protein [Tanacetum cinerariifolium]